MSSIITVILPFCQMTRARAATMDVKQCNCRKQYCLTDLSVDSNDITALVSGEQKHYFHLWGLQKPLVAFATRDFFRPHSWKQCFFTLLSPHSNTTLLVYDLAATIDSLDELRKCLNSAFFVTPAQSCWTVVDSTKSVSAELSDFGQWRQLKVESEIKSAWTLKTILNDIKIILY
jgi:hypothetical protein